MTDSQIAEKRELELVEKVELRLALSDTPEKFEKSLNVFLAPLLLKLASPFDSVRNAVFNSLKHVLSRVSSLKEMKLPIKALLEQAKLPSLPAELLKNSDNVRLYSLLLASKGVDRISGVERKELVPTVMENISSLPTSISSRLFNILCKLMLTWVPPLKGTQEEQQMIKFLEIKNQDDLNFLLDKFTKFFLLNPARPIDAESNGGIIPRGYTCPGLSPDDVAFFTYNAGVSFTKEQIMTYRQAIYRFVCNGFVPDDQLLLKFLSVVSTDPSSLSDSATQHLKRLRTPYEDQDFISYLISLYIGNQATGTPPVQHTLQEKILTVLNSSILATTDANKVSLICSIGLHSTHYKLRSLCLSFIQHVAKHNHHNLLKANNSSEGVQTSIASLIRNNLYSEGWPKLQLGSSTPTFSTALLQRRMQYETLGAIIKKEFSLIEDLSYIDFLFDSLKGDMSEFRPSIQEALLSAIPHLAQLPIESKQKLKKLLRSQLNDDYDLDNPSEGESRDTLMSVRYISIKYANAAFNFDDAEARMLNIWGTSRDNRFDIVEEAVKGLHPYWFRVNQASNSSKFVTTAERLASEVRETQFPKFSQFIKLLLDEVNSAKSNSTSVTRSTLNFAVRFARQCLVSQAIYGETTIIIQDEDWSTRIEKAVQVDDNVRRLLSSMLSNYGDDSYSEFLQVLCCEFITKDYSGNIISISKYHDNVFGEVFRNLLMFSNKAVLKTLEDSIPNLFALLQKIEVTSNYDIELAGNAIGIIATSVPYTESINMIISHLKPESDPDLSVPYLYAGAFISSRLYITGSLKSVVTIDQLNYLLDSALKHVKGVKYRYFGMKALGELFKYGLLSELSKIRRSEVISQFSSSFDNRLLNDDLVTETWSYLALYADELDLFETFLNKLFETHTSKEVEYLFTVGESLSVLAGGWQSSFLQKQIDILGLSPKETPFIAFYSSSSKTNMVLEKVLTACDSTKPSLRRASCIWLLSMVQFLKTEPILARCKEIHFKFMKFLPDNDQFIQESAARGLSLIYELGNHDLKEEMIKGLLKSFTNSTNAISMNSGSVESSTQLFEPGTLNTGDDSISTYKDILNLASEVGDPSLVYKFMSLAKHSSLWSSRKGIAFGLGAIMSKSSLEKLLLEDTNSAKKLIPKLFRYRFDPYSSVANSMNDIWNTLVTDSSSTINVFFEDILQELLSGMSNKEWRVREASTAALLQLIQTQPEDKFSDNILDIWTMGFRTMDDIKESVREVGTKFTTVLAKILVRSIDSSKRVSAEKSTKILGTILPFFLGTKGLNSDADDVRKFALTTLIDLIKNTGKALKPFAPQLIFEFTSLFSSIEPQVINYLALNAENYKIDANVIDMHRRNGVTSSPLFNAIESLLSLTDESDLKELVDHVIKAIKKSIGLPSKVAASQVLILLIKKFGDSLKDYSGKLLKTCMNVLDDRNESICLSYALAFGYIFKVATIEKSVKYCKKLTERYFSTDSDSAARKIVGLAIESIHNNSYSQFESISTILMPLVFVASNDITEENSALYSKIWTEASSSGSGTVKLYLEEILNILSTNIRSLDFTVRRTCANAISNLCGKIDRSVSKDRTRKLFDITIEALEGRSWEGKEMIVDALVSAVNTFKEFLENENDLRSRIDKALVTESSRNNSKYTTKVLFSYSRYLSIFPNESLINESLIPITKSIFKDIEIQNGELSGNDENNEKISKKIKPNEDINRKSSRKNIENEEYIIEVLKAHAAIACGNIELYYFILDSVLNLFDSSMIIYTWRSQSACSRIGTDVLDKLPLTDANAESKLKAYWTTCYNINCRKEATENVKLEFIKFSMKLARKIPSLRAEVEEGMSRLAQLDPTARIELELKNFGL
ncbi:hypothetical protein KAFR_0I01480 [Kazachstania africana CBS 2517]|uniref:Proteasome component ECM29 n=1 Tax=Kazachstania africana (strain ATCC 22294 / BCRC 22015 / CBS 2517 / CECT 1963 / NBRC 1671 / NRRL Y-8276) TaxID=1071382 RepID=H2AZX9_KAZAF|nr:hypothetical protein KAFR_0I01480 [Kazachstania africana CBS 2517]CCF59929.1 hypothetical protein KAFR_0I01480 [Kazachstania africana CBS 2517]